MGSSKFWGGVTAFALASALGAGVAMAQAQGGGNQGKENHGGSNQGGRQPSSRPRIGSQELIGHALSMAIESSGLMATAQQGSYNRAYGPAMGPRGSTGVGIGRGTGAGAPSTGSGAGPTAGSSSAGTSAGSGTGTTGSRNPGLAGQESYVSGNRSQDAPRTERGAAADLSSAPAGTAPGTSPLAGHDAQDARSRRESDRQTLREAGIEGNRFAAVAGSPGMATYVATQLQSHARRGFTDSERLFREAAQQSGDADPAMGRYLQAAQNYARSLEAFAGFTSAENGDAGGRGVAGGGMLGTSDMQSICLVNHAVKEVLDSCKLKAMCRMMGDGAQGADVLRQHAQQMRDDGMRSIQSLASMADTGTGRGAAGGGGTTRTRATNDRGAGARSGESLLDAATAGAANRGANRGVERQADSRPTGGSRPAGAGGGTTSSGAGTGVVGGLSGAGTGAGAQGTVSATDSGSRTSGATRAGGIGAGVAGDRGRVMMMLAQQAQELVQAIDGLEQVNR